jgi:hypothetical protein
MVFVLIGLFLFVTLVFAVKGLSSPEPEVVKRAYKATLFILSLFLIAILLRVGKPFFAALIGIILAAVPYAARILQLLQGYEIIRRFLNKSPIIEPAPNSQMTRAQALQILEVSENATLEEIDESYKRLMKRNHPDTGGSKYFASQLNQARDLLVK